MAVQTKGDTQGPSRAGLAQPTRAGGLVLVWQDHLPMTAFGSVPKAQMHGEPEGT